MQRLADDLVGDMRAVEVAGVDVVDPQPHGFADTAIAPLRSGGGPHAIGP